MRRGEAPGAVRGPYEARRRLQGERAALRGAEDVRVGAGAPQYLYVSPEATQLLFLFGGEPFSISGIDLCLVHPLAERLSGDVQVAGASTCRDSFQDRVCERGACNLILTPVDPNPYAMPCNKGQAGEEKTAYLKVICKPVQHSATTDRSLVMR